MFDKIKDIVSDITSGGDLGDLSLGGYERYLEGISWPVSKDELVDAVRQNGAPDQVVGVLENVGGTTFNGPEDVVGALSGGAGETVETAQGAVDEAAQTGRGKLDDVAGDVRRTL